MKALRSGLAVGILTAVALGCGDAPETEADTEATLESAPAWVDTVAMVADAVEARPGAVDSVLSAHGMTRARLDSLLYEIAGDPALTAAYREARGR